MKTFLAILSLAIAAATGLAHASPTILDFSTLTPANDPRPSADMRCLQRAEAQAPVVALFIRLGWHQPGGATARSSPTLGHPMPMTVRWQLSTFTLPACAG